MSSSEKVNSEKMKQLQERLSYLRWLGLILSMLLLKGRLQTFPSEIITYH